MGWLKKLPAGRMSRATNSTPHVHGPRRARPASRIILIYQTNPWTPRGLRRRPPCVQRDICVLSVRATARMHCGGSWLESDRTGS